MGTAGQATSTSHWFGLLQTITCSAILTILAGVVCQAQQVGPGNILRVMITPTGLQLSQNSVEGGAVRVLIVNRTQMADPQLEFSSTGRATPVSVRLPGPGRQAKTWRSATLPPGRYRLSIVGIRGAEKEVTVQP